MIEKQVEHLGTLELQFIIVIQYVTRTQCMPYDYTGLYNTFFINFVYIEFVLLLILKEVNNTQTSIGRLVILHQST